MKIEFIVYNFQIITPMVKKSFILNKLRCSFHRRNIPNDMVFSCLLSRDSVFCLYCQIPIASNLPIHFCHSRTAVYPKYVIVIYHRLRMNRIIGIYSCNMQKCLRKTPARANYLTTVTDRIVFHVMICTVIF